MQRRESYGGAPGWRGSGLEGLRSLFGVVLRRLEGSAVRAGPSREPLWRAPGGKAGRLPWSHPLEHLHPGSRGAPPIPRPRRAEGAGGEASEGGALARGLALHTLRPSLEAS